MKLFLFTITVISSLGASTLPVVNCFSTPDGLCAAYDFPYTTPVPTITQRFAPPQQFVVEAQWSDFDATPATNEFTNTATSGIVWGHAGSPDSSATINTFTDVHNTPEPGPEVLVFAGLMLVLARFMWRREYE